MTPISKPLLMQVVEICKRIHTLKRIYSRYKGCGGAFFVVGELYKAKVYTRQKDVCTRKWSALAKENENLDIIVIATSDHGFVSIVRKALESGKKVVVLGNRDTSKKLREACSCFYDLDI